MVGKEYLQCRCDLLFALVLPPSIRLHPKEKHFSGVIIISIIYLCIRIGPVFQQQFHNFDVPSISSQMKTSVSLLDLSGSFSV